MATPDPARDSEPLLVDLYDTEGVVRAMRDTLRTTHAVFFHQRDRTLALTTVHPVTTGTGGVPEIGPGRPLSYEDEQSILALLGSRADEEVIDILPDRVLHRDPSTLMWWLPAAVRSMHLRTLNEGLCTVQAHWPALVMMVRERTLYVAAVLGAERPSADTALYHAPLGNIYADTSVCTGSARLPEGPEPRHLAAWEAVITDTAFTHTNHEGTFLAAEGGGKRRKRRAFINANADFWMKRDGLGMLPADQFNPLGVSLGEWLPRVRARDLKGGGRREL
jgi:PRTRC genetic system protein B